MRGSSARLKLLPIDHDAASEPSDWLPVFCRGYVYRHLVAWFERRVTPTFARLGDDIFSFDHPMQCVATLVLRVNSQENVRIGPNERSHGSLHRHRFSRIIRRVSMVREE